MSAVPPPMRMNGMEILLLVVLSLVWGGSFIFAEVALQDLPPLTVVFLRVGLGALAMLVIVLAMGRALPTTMAQWALLAAMALLNNVIPFSLIVWGQTQITASLASILNATTPMFALVIAHLFTADERLSRNKVFGVLLGFAGVGVLVGPAALAGSTSLAGQIAILGAACSYGFASVWGKRLRGLDPMTLAAGQLVASSVILAPLTLIVDQPWTLAVPSAAVVWSVLGLAIFSTALAYIMFFRILREVGAINVSLVTLLIPLSAIAMGVAFFGEPIVARQVFGALVIGAGLLVIDGRVLTLARRPTSIGT
ncbi:MAG: DMT family transporter [Pseudomonadota bacterium]